MSPGLLQSPAASFASGIPWPSPSSSCAMQHQHWHGLRNPTSQLVLSLPRLEMCSQPMHHRRSSPHRLEQSTRDLLKADGRCDVRPLRRETTWELCSKGPWRAWLLTLRNSWLQKHGLDCHDTSHNLFDLVCTCRFRTMQRCSLPFSGHVTCLVTTACEPCDTMFHGAVLEKQHELFL